MMRGILTVSTFISVILFPWPFSVLLAFISAPFVPLVPFAAGIFADTLYYAPHANLLPVFTIAGAFFSVAALFVRSRLMTGIIK